MESKSQLFYKKLEVIGSSNESKIYKLLDIKKNQMCALKLISHKIDQHKDQCYHLHNEFQILQSIKHKNIVDVYKLEVKEAKNDKSKVQQLSSLQSSRQQQCMIIMEICDIDLQKLIQSQFPELLPMSFMKNIMGQVANALYCLHEQANICHFDIKPENIFLKKIQNISELTSSKQIENKALVKKFKSEQEIKPKGKLNLEYDVKMGDFGFAYNYQKLDTDACRKIWDNRNMIYLPYEILEISELLEKGIHFDIQKFDWKAVDVFSFGITLFSSIFLTYPCKRAYVQENDPIYKYIAQKRYEKFWQSIPQVKIILKGVQNAEILKDLIQKMIAFKPEDRIDMKQIERHPWFTQTDSN